MYESEEEIKKSLVTSLRAMKWLSEVRLSRGEARKKGGRGGIIGSLGVEYV